MQEKGAGRKVLAIVAALNEAEGIGPTIEELRLYLEKPFILVVDGRSSDRTAAIARNMYVDVLTQKGIGKGNALAEGLAHVEIDLDYIVLTDADYTYPAKYIPEMVEVLDNYPKIGMVCGNRFNRHFEPKAMKNMFYVGNRLLAFSHNMLNGVAMRDPLTGLRVVRWSVMKNWKPRSKGFDIEVELNHRVESCGYRIAEIDIPYRPRLGTKKLKMRHGLTIIRRILAESFNGKDTANKSF